VTFDERGYIGSAPELRSLVMALSLGGLRRKVEIAHGGGILRRGGAKQKPRQGAGLGGSCLLP
jgi:hypothetical protein